MVQPRPRVVLFGRNASDADTIAITDVLRQETVGGALMLAAAVVAVSWANVSPVSYAAVLHLPLGPLDLEHWVADGLLAIFFFVAGLELKRELTVGALSRPAQALVPIAAALCGMAVPAAIFVLVNLTLAGGRPQGWAIPMATDIAFALAILGLVGSRLPTGLRAFLLTLAIVDDLGSIAVIAIFFAHGLSALWLLAALGCAGLWLLLQWRRIRGWYLYLPLGILCWTCMYASGVHATVAGVVLGLLTSSNVSRGPSVVDVWEHRWRPISAGVAVPVFALVAAGVPVSIDKLSAALTSPVGIGVVLGLVGGKFLGVFGGAWLTARLTRAELAAELRWSEIASVALLAGVGFTVALLIGDLAFADDPALQEVAKTGVLVGSVIAAVLASISLRRRTRSRAA
ncbi:sodium/proton antiporter [Microlunatus phosphovorus NM-1]|uniref:Na(+)/H(+) antiporter NhaA n=1 Tax=Microlunatus phosphovorus (strain ATCC 700054 / DSM 10555 / JCM 9379 / NBRC 101784 / NCIMB 13414 / VKM Ac-1990 / NM-1) TaxID=1032480 RepID=F5XG76_MICPN|nr:Na+/H+ antiporter NhaA [Microlunatus phosphovorus]BAK38010.1 sodium/proton antiporter [Microlunatus phosphovorus NM-1]